MGSVFRDGLGFMWLNKYVVDFFLGIKLVYIEWQIVNFSKII